MTFNFLIKISYIKTGIGEIIQKFGFSHQVLADYLSVSVANMKLIATGRRELSTSASIKLAQLQLTFMHEDVTEKDFVVLETETDIKMYPLLHAE